MPHYPLEANILERHANGLLAVRRGSECSQEQPEWPSGIDDRTHSRNNEHARRRTSHLRDAPIRPSWSLMDAAQGGTRQNSATARGSKSRSTPARPELIESQDDAVRGGGLLKRGHVSVQGVFAHDGAFRVGPREIPGREGRMKFMASVGRGLRQGLHGSGTPAGRFWPLRAGFDPDRVASSISLNPRRLHGRNQD